MKPIQFAYSGVANMGDKLNEYYILKEIMYCIKDGFINHNF